MSLPPLLRRDRSDSARRDLEAARTGEQLRFVVHPVLGVGKDAAKRGRNLGDRVATEVENTASVRTTEELVSRERVGVHAESVHVDLGRPDCLRAVRDDEHAMLVCERRDRPQVDAHPECEVDIRDEKDTRLRRDSPLESRNRFRWLVAEVEPPQLQAAPFGDRAQRNDGGRILEPARENLVAGDERSSPQSAILSAVVVDSQSAISLGVQPTTPAATPRACSIRSS